ncbi:hypothetical protein [Cohnella abietis]|uniref:Uncharacterized protein n=1 Tax=Cohnella abietis TaxID=2507935 RepID=A0A3T1DCZ0_9BACL|nr:hypothetical protein [Cohnella abietis]BBI35962.1 hypothetical protein KCTCHS21_53610 [Cohnella abietis]
MGLDILLYDNKNSLVSILEIKAELHEAIFASHKRWKSLRKLSDNYSTNAEFSGEGLEGLVTDLKNYKSLMIVEHQKAFHMLLEALSDNKVQRVQINGD